MPWAYYEGMLQNRYVKLTLLTIGLAAIFYIVLYLLFMMLGLNLPAGLQLMVAVLAAGYIVYQYFSQRIA